MKTRSSTAALKSAAGDIMRTRSRTVVLKSAAGDIVSQVKNGRAGAKGCQVQRELSGPGVREGRCRAMFDGPERSGESHLSAKIHGSPG